MNDKLLRIKEYVVTRISETSTWRGVVLAMTALGYKLSPEQKELVLFLGIGLAGVIGAVLGDNHPPKPKEDESDK